MSCVLRSYLLVNYISAKPETRAERYSSFGTFTVTYLMVVYFTDLFSFFILLRLSNIYHLQSLEKVGRSRTGNLEKYGPDRFVIFAYNGTHIKFHKVSGIIKYLDTRPGPDYRLH